MAIQDKPRLAIVGVGDYYRMISPGIDKVFETVAKIDRPDFDPKPGGLRDLVRSYNPDAVMVLTPNRVHAEHIEEVSQVGVPVFVEKPLVTSQEDLDRVVATTTINPALYCSDFYIDIWDAPLLKWLGLPCPSCLDPCIEISKPESDEWMQGRAQLGEIVSVEATLLEGVGPASSFVGREWLWDAEHGGVLWDMGYHELALWFRLIGEPLYARFAERSTIAGAPPGASETYAAAKMESTSGIKFNFRVGKYVDTGDDRAFKIIGTKGEVSMDFVDPGRLVLNGNTDEPLAVLHGERLDHAAAVFREYVDSHPTEPYGLDIALQCVHTVLEIRSKWSADASST